MSISVKCRSRRDLEIRDLGNFFRVFLGNSTITVVRFNAKSTLNTNGSGSSGSNNTWSISTSTYSDSYNTWSISTSTLQWQQQYMVNINLDFAVAATIHGQYQPRPTVAATIHGQYQPRLCSDSYNTWSISTSTLQWQLQYMVNINLDLQWQQQYMVNIKLDFAVAATIHGQYQPWLISSSCNIRSISTSTYCDVN